MTTLKGSIEIECGNSFHNDSGKKTVTCRNLLLIMSLDSTQFVSSNFAEFLLDNANNGDEILAVLDDIVEVQTAL